LSEAEGMDIFMKEAVCGGFFLLSGTIFITGSHITNAGNVFMNTIGGLFLIIGAFLCIYSLFTD